MKEEKPKYGWYGAGFILPVLIIGLIGLSLVIIGIYLEELLQYILIITGIVLMVIFLWPAMGMIILNLTIGDDSFFSMKINSFDIDIPKILDVGCGTGRSVISMAKELKNGAKIIGIDVFDPREISGNSLETVQKNARLEGVNNKAIFQYGSATEIPFEDESFDIITVVSVLHDLHDSRDLEKAVKEIYRVLKPEGHLIMGEWNRKSWQLVAMSGLFCMVFKKTQFWNKILEKHNFKVESYDNFGGFGIFTVKK